MSDELPLNRRQTDVELAKIRTEQSQLRREFRELKHDVQQLMEFIRGGLDGSRDPIATRMHNAENHYQELMLLFKQLQLAIEGHPMDRKESLNYKIQKAIETANAAKEVAEGRETSKIARRGQTVTLIGSGLFFLGTVLAALLSSWDKVPFVPRKPKDPIAYAQQLRDEIEKLRPIRGPEVDKLLKDIEDAARRVRKGL